ncbi:endonuclease/exonuclease/phosphatase family protein [Actinomycetaceae bacterium MB13-C1-2]|nr:endonuclease/exonuclease/phosphatase family protein [Actinomycetaceae bacterium MB13-C1-2]
MTAELIVASYNVWVQAPQNTTAQLELLWAEGVEIAGLQEVSEGVSTPEVAGGSVVNRLSVIESGPFEHVAFGKAITYGGGQYGNAIISRRKFTGVETLNLPRAAAAEDRCALRADILLDSDAVSFYTAHLSFESTRLRTLQLQVLKRMMDEDPNEYRILTADFNTDQNLDELDLFRPDYQLVNGNEDDWRETFRGDMDSEMKHRMIDNIIVSKNIKVLDWDVVDSDLSDHSPLKAALILD